MKDQQTVQTIRDHAKHIFAVQGYDGLSMRTLATSSRAGLSSIYHFFADKDVLLRDIYERTNTSLGTERQKLRTRNNAEQMMKDLVAFQFEHMEDIVFVLKYYLHYRQTFLALPTKILPPKAYLHVEEVLHKGIGSGEFSIPGNEIESRAKIVTHAINGFLLEYFPYLPTPAERKALVSQITEFTMRSLKYKEPPMQQ